MMVGFAFLEPKRSAIQDSYSIRRSALQQRVTYYTTMSEARAACIGIQLMKEIQVFDLQGLHRRLGARGRGLTG